MRAIYDKTINIITSDKTSVSNICEVISKRKMNNLKGTKWFDR